MQNISDLTNRSPKEIDSRRISRVCENTAKSATSNPIYMTEQRGLGNDGFGVTGMTSCGHWNHSTLQRADTALHRQRTRKNKLQIFCGTHSGICTQMTSASEIRNAANFNVRILISF